jgi:hypothetical protein
MSHPPQKKRLLSWLMARGSRPFTVANVMTAVGATHGRARNLLLWVKANGYAQRLERHGVYVSLVFPDPVIEVRRRLGPPQTTERPLTQP